MKQLCHASMLDSFQMIFDHFSRNFIRMNSSSRLLLNWIVFNHNLLCSCNQRQLPCNQKHFDAKFNSLLQVRDIHFEPDQLQVYSFCAINIISTFIVAKFTSFDVESSWFFFYLNVYQSVNLISVIKITALMKKNVDIYFFRISNWNIL